MRKALFLAAAFLAAAAHADEHYFGYVKTADVLPQGASEFEQWVTNRNGKAHEVYSAWDLRTELEYGVTDRLSSAIYFNFKDTYESTLDLGTGLVTSTEETLFEGISLELKYQVLNPSKSPLGLVLYYEPSFGHGEWENELKVILSTETESWVAALNLTAEPEWERDALVQKEELPLEASAGLAYKLSPTFSLGLEARTHTEIPDFLHGGVQEHQAYFLGPSVHWAAEKFNVALTVLPQLRGWPVTLSEEDGRHLSQHEMLETRFVLSIPL